MLMGIDKRLTVGYTRESGAREIKAGCRQPIFFPVP